MSKRKKKYYAVVEGYNWGIFNDWNICRELTDGCPESKFKGFTNFKDAQAYFLEERGFLIEEWELNVKI